MNEAVLTSKLVELAQMTAQVAAPAAGRPIKGNSTGTYLSQKPASGTGSQPGANSTGANVSGARNPAMPAGAHAGGAQTGIRISLEELMDTLHLQVNYLLFDLEATRRENRYLRHIIENRPKPLDEPPAEEEQE